MSSCGSRKVLTGTARRLFTDGFKREVVGLLASSGRPLSQTAQELGSAASRQRAWRNRGDRGTWDLGAENDRLRRGNERMGTEWEILKKKLGIFSEAPR